MVDIRQDMVKVRERAEEILRNHPWENNPRGSLYVALGEYWENNPRVSLYMALGDYLDLKSEEELSEILRETILSLEIRELAAIFAEDESRNYRKAATELIIRVLLDQELGVVH